MLSFSVYDIVIGLSSIVIASYLFTIISKKTRIPTVLLLMTLGIILRAISVQFGWHFPIPFDVIKFLGVIGLILILLEAGLDLKITSQTARLITRAGMSSLFVLVLSVIGIATVIYFLLGQTAYASVLYAIPLSVISSTVVASSVGYLSQKKRNFLTYESAFSDIIGILAFDLLLASESFSIGIVAYNLLSIIIAFVVSVIVSLILVWIATRVRIEIKAFLIFSVLLLLYAVGHKLQFPTLLAVLVFGLVINNWRYFRGRLKSHGLRQALPTREVEPVAETVSSVTQESAFIVRTFFFVLFGYTVEIGSILQLNTLLVGSIITLVIFLVRYIYLRLFLKEHVLPELFFSPRGLVTIVLFYSIPPSLVSAGVDASIIFFVIMATTIIMFVGSVYFTPEADTKIAEENGQTDDTSSAKEEVK